MINVAGGRTDTAPLRVLIVGAGRRVRNNFLPALAVLAPGFMAAGIVSPSAERRGPLARQWGVPEFSSIAQVDLSKIDVVAISVPTAQNAIVLKQLTPAAAALQLIIDTPIAWSLAELAACSALLHKFAHVGVAEDYMNFPPHTLMRRAVKAGLIGTPRSMVLNNTGYYYHGLALIRSMVGFKPVTRTRRLAMSSSAVSVRYRVGDMQATVIGPYRRHSAGGTEVEGVAGKITEFEADVVAGQRHSYHLRPTRESGNIVGYEIDGADGMSLPLPELPIMRAMDFPDKSELNLLRGWGLMQVFKSLQDATNENRQYTPRQAFYDSFFSRLASKRRLPFDPFLVFGGDALTPLVALGGLLSRLKRS